MVTLLRPEEVPKDLICSICMSVPSKPCFLQPCDHVFCQDCARQTLTLHHSTCPIDRKPCTIEQIRRFKDGSLIHRIWSSIMVKCESCSWTGSIADDESHKKKCRKARRPPARSESDKILIATLKAEKSALEREKREMEEQLDLMVDEVNWSEARSLKLTIDLAQMTEKVAELEAQNSKLQVGMLKLERIGKVVQNQKEKPLEKRTGGYAYDRFKVVPLAKLIMQDLESKPDYINANKIYDCLVSIYRDFQRGWEDNPDHFYKDLRMLITMCSTSTWFTNRQQENFQKWMIEQEWA